MNEKLFENDWGVLLQPWEDPVDTRSQLLPRADDSGGGSCDDTGCGETCSGSCENSGCGSCDPDCDESEKKKTDKTGKPKPAEKPKDNLALAFD